jgi:hypothetical protein
MAGLVEGGGRSHEGKCQQSRHEVVRALDHQQDAQGQVQQAEEVGHGDRGSGLSRQVRLADQGDQPEQEPDDEPGEVEDHQHLVGP